MQFGPSPLASAASELRHQGNAPLQRLTIGEKKIFAVSFLLIALVVVATLVVMNGLRREAVQARLRSLANLALPLAGETDRAFQAMDLVLRNVTERIESAGIRDAAQLESAMSTLDAHDLMRARIAALVYIDALTLVGESGKVLNTTRYWPAPDLNFGDRAYFKALQDLSAQPTFLSQPVIGRIGNRLNLVLTRRITSATGSFLGVVNAAIDQAYFEVALSNVDLGPGGTIAFVRSDGSLLAKSPGGIGFAGDEPDGSSDVLAKTLTALSPQGGVLAPGVLDQHERLAAVRPLANFPASIVVSLTTQSFNEEVSAALLPTVIAAFLICLVIGLIGAAFGRQARNQRRLAATQHRQARADTLTGLHNRLWCAEHLERLTQSVDARPFALLIIGLDFFKAINDQLGHDVGDAVLKAVSARLSEGLEAHDALARVGGDEFAITRRGISGETDALTLAHRIIAAIKAPITVGPHQIVTGCSIGVALFPADGDAVVTLLKKADLALYKAKADGRSVARVFSEQITLAAQTRYALQRDLDDAWRQRQFYIAYQPIFEINSRTLAGFEALLRWKHPERGQVGPDVFIPVAEETGLILALGAWVIEEACREAMRWQGDLFVSVNLSPVQFRGSALQQQVVAALDRSGLPGRRLELEVTESTLLHEGAAVQTAFDGFRRLGIAVALDDFGTGYSSLAYLKHLKIDRLKVDRSFVSDAVSNPQGRAILNAIFALAAALGVETTAEGVETEEQIAILRQQGCSHLQGFLLGRPMARDDVSQLVLTSLGVR
ncbi:EAL domain-containing protein [Bosea sp. AAP35]|uniref:putative bifunctional diguanylate cyclase/phosphodiesterase n=1 Tax=Bosea sp. AAP35 TaxID=1523417 RepID=UPI0006B9159A|nr:EAL domain-containing protein [Bosea sp. AAP35]